MWAVETVVKYACCDECVGTVDVVEMNSKAVVDFQPQILLCAMSHCVYVYYVVACVHIFCM